MNSQSGTVLRAPHISRRAIVLAPGLLLLAAGTRSLAQGFGRVASQPWSGGVTVVNRIAAAREWRHVGDTAVVSSARDIAGLARGGDQPTAPTPAPQPPERLAVDLSPVLAAAWKTALPKVRAKLEAALHERNIGGGFRTSRNQLALAQGGPMFVGTDGAGFTFRYVLQGNRLKTWLRTPTALDRSADPGFEVGFDIDMSMDVTVKGNQLATSRARLKPTVHRPDSTNLTGDLALGLANLMRFLGGPDFVRQFQSTLNEKQFEFNPGINAELARLNPLLSKAARGGSVQTGYDSRTQSVVLSLVKTKMAPVVR